jgi:hypothetical protein
MLSRLCARLPLLFILTPALAQLQWQRPVGPLQLTPRFGAQMVDDAARGRLVLFGGTDYANRLAETWEWDGSSGTNGSPAVRPPARSAFGFTYDGIRGRVVVCGVSVAAAASGIALADLWEWDGSAWTALARVEVPRRAAIVAASFDYARARGSCFRWQCGQRTGSSPIHIGNGMEQCGRRGPPDQPARQGASLSYDQVRNRTVLFGGQEHLPRFQLPDIW